MKRIFATIEFILLIFFSSANALFPQWSTDPNNNLIVGYGLDPHICSDSAGGCYITYDYESTSYPRKLALERLDRFGYKPWEDKIQILGELPQQYRAKIIEDGEGGALVSYIDRYQNLPTWTQRVRVQKVDSGGNFLWGQIGVRVTMDTINQGDHHLATDGNGGCVIAWQDINYIYFINRIDRDGNRLWGDNGITLNTGGSNAQPIVINAADGNYYLQAGTIVYRINQNGEILNQFSSTILGQPVPDPEGGVVVSGFIGNIYNRKLVSQRKDSLGNNLWQEPYVEIADSLHINTMLSIIQNNGYYFYGWMGRINGNDEILQIQGLRDDGTLLFNQGSISLSNNSGVTTYIPIVPSDSGSFIFISSYINGTFGQKIDTLGSLRWNHNQVLLNYPQIGLSSSFVTSDCVAGAIGLGDYLTDFAIPVFKISTNGILGEVITDLNGNEEETILRATILFQNFPNPYNSSTTIQFQLPKESKININLYNILGEKIQTIANGVYPQGINSILFSSDNLPSGIYLYKMQTETKSLTKKLIIIK